MRLGVVRSWCGREAGAASGAGWLSFRPVSTLGRLCLTLRGVRGVAGISVWVGLIAWLYGDFGGVGGAGKRYGAWVGRVIGRVASLCTADGALGAWLVLGYGSG